jgi:hypothetical protein
VAGGIGGRDVFSLEFWLSSIRFGIQTGRLVRAHSQRSKFTVICGGSFAFFLPLFLLESLRVGGQDLLIRRESRVWFVHGGQPRRIALRTIDSRRWSIFAGSSCGALFARARS